MSLLDDLLTSAIKSSYEKNKRKESEPSILGALKDPQFLQDMKRGVLDSVNRGAVASTIGGPVDLATMLMRPFGYNVEKPTGGSEWVGDKMQQLGLLGDTRNPIAEAIASVAVPGAMAKVAPKVFQAEQAAIQNAKIAGPLSDGKFATQRGVFGGLSAKTADKAKLSQAEQMLNKGIDPAQVWKETGWGRGPDGKWRFEISDDAAKLVNVPVNKSWEQFANAAETEKYGRRGANVSSMSAKEFKDFKKWRAGLEDEYNKTNATMRPLSEIFQHEQAASAYPDVYNPLSAHWDASMGKNGSFGNGKIAFGDVSNQEGVKGLFGHELQHAIQQREGFARGGSPDSAAMDKVKEINESLSWVAREKDAIKEMQYQPGVDPQNVKKQLHELETMYRDLLNDRANIDHFGTYQRLGGEAEARLVQSRMNLTPEERAAQYPWNADYFKQQTGVGLDDLIHRFDGGEAKSVGFQYPQDAALETARQNGVKMLGLPENNTALDRANILFPNDTWHGTDRVFDNFDMSKASQRSQYMPGVFTADNPELASNFGDVLMPLRQRDGVTVLDKVKAKRQWLPEPTVDSIHDKAAGIRVTNNPANIRSRFAAFDPARVNEADLLAGAMPFGLLLDPDMRDKFGR